MTLLGILLLVLLEWAVVKELGRDSYPPDPEVINAIQNSVTE